MDSNEADVRMPEIGRSVIHEEGLALVREWIDSLRQLRIAPCPAKTRSGSGFFFRLCSSLFLPSLGNSTSAWENPGSSLQEREYDQRIATHRRPGQGIS